MEHSGWVQRLTRLGLLALTVMSGAGCGGDVTGAVSGGPGGALSTSSASGGQSSGGTAAQGGNPEGGSALGGLSFGGSATGGFGQGGTATGGTATGGATASGGTVCITARTAARRSC